MLGWELLEAPAGDRAHRHLVVNAGQLRLLMRTFANRKQPRGGVRVEHLEAGGGCL